MLAITNYF